ncbi:hypothetical protein CDEST_01329 [Colletotrichum destructivum]|uniref:Uncharacterized protein n=1 Tax=Colletotrichum destructivum TaxID=34406 RepID=A0AAX4HYX0_9PEZI|nr:hypothetical protein CDEST_01329 [Colletotrichum destructivum]
MWSISVKHLVLLLLGLANFTLADKILLGYRRVNKLEADQIKKEKNIFRDIKFDEKAKLKGWAQIGYGVYLSMAVHSYRDNPKDWWCYVEAERDQLVAAPKVWIPKDYWYHPEEEIEGYVQSQLAKKEHASSAIRMSKVEAGHENNIQMLIPTWMVQQNVLETSARCYQTVNELPYVNPVSYENWPNFRNEPNVGEDEESSSGGRRKGKAEKGKTAKGKPEKGKPEKGKIEKGKTRKGKPRPQ